MCRACDSGLLRRSPQPKQRARSAYCRRSNLREGRRLASAVEALARGLTRKLTDLDLSAKLTIVAPAKTPLFVSRGLVPIDPAIHPTASYALQLDGKVLELDLYASPPFRSQRLLAALAAGIAALLVGGTLQMWGVSRWLIIPLRHLTTQVDAIAGGDTIEIPATSPIREVDYVARAIAGMGVRAHSNG